MSKITDMMDNFNRIASDEEKSQALRDKVHDLVKVEAVLIAKSSLPMIKKLALPGIEDVEVIGLAATLEAFVAFLLTQNKIILREEVE